MVLNKMVVLLLVRVDRVVFFLMVLVALLQVVPGKMQMAQ
jgi:hypothetical protein